MSPVKQHRYGELILTTPEGRFFWSWVLDVVSFVPKGCQTATETDVARSRNEAVRIALKSMDIRLHV